jgi:protein TonB
MYNITVEFAPDALNTIKADVIRAFKSIPRRGAEAGGLLCGAIVESGIAAVVRIDSVIPVPVEHRFGPAYRLSGMDKRNFEKAIQDWAPLGIIGWYRSQTRLGDAPDPEDRVVTAEFFPARQSAFLICYPDASLNVPGKLCLWVQGKDEEFTRIELGRHSLLDQALQSAAENSEPAAPEPARMPELRMPELREKPVERAGFTAPLQQSLPQAIPQAAFPQTPPQSTTRNGRIALILTLAVAISFGAYLVHARLQPGSQGLAQVRPGVLGMRVDRQGGSLLVSWNRQAPEILQASTARFRIVSGERSRTLALSPHELRTGSLLYTLSAEDIEMELNVSGPVGDFAESVRVLGAAPGEQLALTPVTPRPAMETPAHSEQPPRSEPVVRPAPKSEDLRVVEAAPKPAPALPLQQQRPAPRAFVEPPRVTKTGDKPLGPEATPPEAPLIQVATNLPPAVPMGVAGLPPQRNAAPGNAIDYVGPRAIRSVQPSVNATSTSMERAFAQTDKPHSVEVEVSIDERGAVSNATVGASTGPFAYLFVDAALAAARRWQFEPARRGGRPVASKMTVKFDFVKNTH